MLHLDNDWLRAVRQEYGRGDQVAEPVRIVTAPAFYNRFCRLNEQLFSDAHPSDKEAALIEFIGDSDSEPGAYIQPPRMPSHLAEQIRPALIRLGATPDAHIALGELAHLTGMSRYQLIRAFRTITGMTPHAWQLNQRVNLARAQIRNGERIVDVALRLGFADQAHFQRVFKAHAGVTPGDFRA